MSKGRFIAGAVCPECQMMDRVLVETVQQVEQRRCVNCGYTDQLVQSHLGGVPRGKPEKQSNATEDAQQTQKIRIFDPQAPRD